MFRNIFLIALISFASFLTINIQAFNKPVAVENFSLKDYNGEVHSLADYSTSTAIVVMFIATRCPVSNDYNSRMEQIYSDYKDKGIVFLGINSNKQEDAEEVKNHAEENGLNFTILKDPGNIVADKFEASVTPEIFVISNSMEVLYHGRIDDSRRESEVETNDLRIALNEVLEGKTPANAETKAFGCSIKRIEK
ncbi:thioredoxin family protein [Bacteroidota bacterium]